jgi:RNA polymerase sigma-70 factor (ECF subfamily)
VAEKERSEPYTPEHLELIRECRRGDRKAQFEIYRLYHQSMYNTSLRIVGDPDDAEDVMQEAFLKAFIKLKTYKGEVSFGAWLKRIVVNKALDFLRSRKEKISIEEMGEIGDSDNEQPAMLETAHRADAVKKAIYALPEGYRIVLSLILIEGYDHEEVSEILGISNATSRTQFHRAKKKLLELLKETERDNG